MRPAGPVVNADSPGELAERIRIAYMAPPDGAVPLASWRSYLARARKRREYDDAVARIWREKKPRARRSRPRRAVAQQAGPSGVA